ncbi:hypothetical protein SETIT_1G124000v2 [Setaria italica]|uniref:Transposase Tnp1/En/Spm-like domain-containing protein n=1 Tax=Setaria italica TaxID=4555 RepID=A0A368PK25_SETIT|nr:hypothetical protein SETIT_1G124000v2 [Setaria italica]
MLGYEYVAVAVHIVTDIGDEDLPRPYDNICTVRDAIGYVIAWPRSRMAPKRAPSSEADASKMKKTKIERPTTQELPWSLVDNDLLDIMVERGLVLGWRLVCPPRSERVPTPKPNEVVVFIEQYECGLHFPC